MLLFSWTHAGKKSPPSTQTHKKPLHVRISYFTVFKSLHPRHIADAEQASDLHKLQHGTLWPGGPVLSYILLVLELKMLLVPRVYAVPIPHYSGNFG